MMNRKNIQKTKTFNAHSLLSGPRISQPPALCLAPGPSPGPRPPALVSNLYLATLALNLYLPALALNLPVQVPNLCLLALAPNF